jgi:hypothetical protein
VRVVRFPARPTRVSDDIRAALASLGKGGNLVGGVALLGATPPDSGLVIDAVLVLPRGVFVVVGVDLPDPAMTLTAPLHGEWKADGWPLVRPDDEGENTKDAEADDGTPVNPAVTALASARRCADRIHDIDPSVGVGVIIAVGPFVGTVEQPPEDLAGPVRVIHPSATSMLSAIEALPSPPQPLTVHQARAVLGGLAPSATGFDDAALVAEGFVSSSTADPEPSAVSTTPQRPSAPSGHVTGPPRSPKRRSVVVALAALLLIAVTAILVNTVGPGDTPISASPARHPVDPRPSVTAGGVTFTPVAHEHSATCEPRHAVGDVQVYLTQHGCADLRRGSFTSGSDGRAVAVSVGAVTFADDTVAAEFHTLAELPGTGTLTDIATQTGQWPTPVPEFADAAYLTRREGTTVRLVLVDPLAEETEPGDDLPLRVARAALELPLS